MKKILFTLSLLVASFAFVSCDDDDDEVVITANELPAVSQTFLATHFPGHTANYVTRDNDSYDVYLSNGFEVDFYLSGDWDSVSGHTMEVPASVIALIPAAIPAYVATNFPTLFIVEVNREPYGYEIELNSRLELEFDATGNFIRIDN